jgi:tetratricopeptide (TPR) repeat protein
VSDDKYSVARLDEIERLGQWLPVRAQLGIEAFGINAWRPGEDGTIIDDHHEERTGHEELYLVLEGHATFTVGGEEIDAPAGTLVFVGDPSLQRKAISTDPSTTVLAVGAKPEEAFKQMPWEVNREVFPLFDAGEFERAYEILVGAAKNNPSAGGILYNLACAESQLGRKAEALEHLRRAVEIDASFAEYAQEDHDLEAIRSEPGFPRP